LALAGILLVMVQRRFGVWSLVPVLAGILGGATRYGPLLLLGTLAMCLNAPQFFGPAIARRSFVDVSDLVLCGSVLAYVVAQYRLQSLALEVFPPDPRRRQERGQRKGIWSVLRGGLRVVRERRSLGLVSTQEIGKVMLSLPIFVAMAEICWLAVPAVRRNPGLQRPVWHAVLLTWLFGWVWLVGGTAIDYLRRRRMRVAEAELLLQDCLWAETRREQRRIQRWLTWGRRRAARREEQA
jgi:hypothetical protein